MPTGLCDDCDSEDEAHEQPAETTTRRVVSARIASMPARLGDPPPEVWVTFDDGEEVRLFHFFSDEYTFTTDEFLGLTEEEARELHFNRDRAYLLDDPATEQRGSDQKSETND